MSREVVLSVLSGLKEPGTGKNLDISNSAKALNIGSKEISFVVELSTEFEAYREIVKSEAKRELQRVYPDTEIKITFTTHILPEGQAPPKQTPKLKIGGHPTAVKEKIKPHNVKKLIAIGSGKGGVGKSTVSANIAVALTTLGFSVGLLDADVYGPSQPRVMGITGKPTTGGPENKTLIPLIGFGVTVMSMGFLVPHKEAVVWRGPMLMGAIQQFVGQVDWGSLDVLLIDLPPGTGDVQLTLAQKCELDGAVIVSTPQDVALLDARKAINMFYKLQIPIIGMIENMSTFVCRNCGHEEHLFGEKGARNEARNAGITFLGEIPLNIAYRESADNGHPIVAQNPQSQESQYFISIAKKLSSTINL